MAANPTCRCGWGDDGTAQCPLHQPVPSLDSRSPDAPSGETNRVCGSQGVDADGRCVRCGLEAPDRALDTETECPAGFLVSSSAPSGEPISSGTPLDLVASVYAWRDRWEAVVSPLAIAELNQTLRDFGKAHLAREQSAPSAEGMPESEVERDARDRLNRYSGGVRSWDGWPKNELASRRMDLRIVLNRLAKAEAEISRLTREKDEAVQAEREACARLVEGAHERWVQLRETTCDLIAEEIRARASSPPGATT